MAEKEIDLTPVALPPHPSTVDELCPMARVVMDMIKMEYMMELAALGEQERKSGINVSNFNALSQSSKNSDQMELSSHSAENQPDILCGSGLFVLNDISTATRDEAPYNEILPESGIDVDQWNENAEYQDEDAFNIDFENVDQETASPPGDYPYTSSPIDPEKWEEIANGETVRHFMSNFSYTSKDSESEINFSSDIQNGVGIAASQDDALTPEYHFRPISSSQMNHCLLAGNSSQKLPKNDSILAKLTALNNCAEMAVNNGDNDDDNGTGSQAGIRPVYPVTGIVPLATPALEFIPAENRSAFPDLTNGRVAASETNNNGSIPFFATSPNSSSNSSNTSSIMAMCEEKGLGQGLNLAECLMPTQTPNRPNGCENGEGFHFANIRESTLKKLKSRLGARVVGKNRAGKPVKLKQTTLKFPPKYANANRSPPKSDAYVENSTAKKQKNSKITDHFIPVHN